MGGHSSLDAFFDAGAVPRDPLLVGAGDFAVAERASPSDQLEGRIGTCDHVRRIRSAAARHGACSPGFSPPIERKERQGHEINVAGAVPSHPLQPTSRPRRDSDRAISPADAAVGFLGTPAHRHQWTERDPHPRLPENSRLRRADDSRLPFHAGFRRDTGNENHPGPEADGDTDARRASAHALSEPSDVSQGSTPLSSAREPDGRDRRSRSFGRARSMPSDPSIPPSRSIGWQARVKAKRTMRWILQKKDPRTGDVNRSPGCGEGEPP